MIWLYLRAVLGRAFRVTRTEMGIGARGLFFLGTGFGLLGLGVGATTAVFVPTTTTTTTTSTSSSTTTTTTVPSGTCPVGWPSRAGTLWPCAGTTGVPAATLLAAGVASPNLLPQVAGFTLTTCGETNPAHGTVGGVIDGKFVNGSITVRAGNGFSDSGHPCLTVRNSLVRGAIDTFFTGLACTGSPANGICGPVVITDTEVAPPDCPGGSCTETFGVRGPNNHATRINCHNSTHPCFYEDLSYTELRDSYVHGIYANTTTHTAAVAINVGSTGAYNVFDHNLMSTDRSGGFWTCDATTCGGFSDVFNIYIQQSNSHDNTVTNNYLTGSPADAGASCMITDLATTYVDATGTHGTVYPGTFNGPTGGSWDSWNENYANNVFDTANCKDGSGNAVARLIDPAYMNATGLRNAITNGYRADWNFPAQPYVSPANAGLAHNNKWCNNLTTAGAAVGPSVC